MEVHEQRVADAVEEAPVAPAPYPPPPPRGVEGEVVGRRVARPPVTPVAPMAPVAPVAPVEPVAPVAPRRGYVRTSYVSSMPVGFRARQLLWLVYGIVAAFLILDLIFHAAGANTASSFVTFVYNVGGAFNMPFRNIFTGERPGVSTIEWADVIALAVYAFATWVVERAILILRTPSQPVPGPY